MNIISIISTVILFIVAIVIFTILMLIIAWIMFYTINFCLGFVEALEDFVNTQKNK